MVRLSDDRAFVVADVPGLIKGAHRGRGSRTSILAAPGANARSGSFAGGELDPRRTPLRDYQTLRHELALYDSALAGRTEVLVLNKLDLPDTRKKFTALKRLFARRGLRLLGISAVTGEGIAGLHAAVWSALEQARAAETAARDASPDPKLRRDIARGPGI